MKGAKASRKMMLARENQSTSLGRRRQVVTIPHTSPGTLRCPCVGTHQSNQPAPQEKAGSSENKVLRRRKSQVLISR
jgi:hypothetical protein